MLVAATGAVGQEPQRVLTGRVTATTRPHRSQYRMTTCSMTANTNPVSTAHHQSQTRPDHTYLTPNVKIRQLFLVVLVVTYVAALFVICPSDIRKTFHTRSKDARALKHPNARHASVLPSSGLQLCECEIVYLPDIYCCYIKTPSQYTT